MRRTRNRDGTAASAGSTPASQPGEPASTSAGTCSRSAANLVNARIRAGTFLRGSRVPRKAIHGSSPRARCALSWCTSSADGTWNRARSTPWWATVSRRRSCTGVPDQFVRGRRRRHEAGRGPSQRGPGPGPEEPALDPEVQTPVGEERRVVQSHHHRDRRGQRHRVVRGVDDVDRRAAGQPRQRGLFPGQTGPAGCPVPRPPGSPDCPAPARRRLAASRAGTPGEGGSRPRRAPRRCCRRSGRHRRDRPGWRSHRSAPEAGS